MLVYVDTPSAIRVVRSRDAENPKNVPLGIIVKPGYVFRPARDVQISDEETQEIQTLLSQYLTASKGQKHWALLTYPETTRCVLEYYDADATDAEKRLVSATILRAARALRVRAPRGVEDGTPDAKVKPASQSAQPSPSAVAAALYDILAQGQSSKLTGDPRAGKKTRIAGLFDLEDVARKLLARA